jgi:hypothetical protein
MFHFLDFIEKRFYQREELAEAGLLAKTLLVSFHRIPFYRQNPAFGLFVSAQQAVSETMFGISQIRLGLLISLFKRFSVLCLDSVTDDFGVLSRHIVFHLAASPAEHGSAFRFRPHLFD